MERRERDCKPDLVYRRKLRQPPIMNLGRDLRHASCDLPGSRDEPGRFVSPNMAETTCGNCPLIWSCTWWGLPSRPGHPNRWWALTSPFHPYPLQERTPETSAVCFLWHFPCPRGRWALPTTIPCGVRTFLQAANGPAIGHPSPVVRNHTILMPNSPGEFPKSPRSSSKIFR